MKRDKQLKEMERHLLIAILRLRERAYGVTIREELEELLGRSVSIGAIYTTLQRMEESGFVSSWLGEPTARRGGRAKKFFRLNAAGERALRQAQGESARVWAALPAGSRAWA